MPLSKYSNKFLNELKKGEYVSMKGLVDYLVFEGIKGTEWQADQWMLLLVIQSKAFKDQKLIIKSAMNDLSDMIIMEKIK